MPNEGWKSLSVPDALYARMKELGEKTGENLSRIACKAFDWFMEEYVVA